MTVTLLHVVATFECEGCGHPFGVMIDNDACTKETIFELAVENLYNGQSSGPTYRLCALIDDVPLCSACSLVIHAALRDEGIKTEDAKREWMLRKLHTVAKKKTA